MTEPATTPPASYCPDAAHTLQWGLHPDSSTQGWILRDGSSVVATLDGYPHGRMPVPASEAREWADRILGAAQEWVEQPARSGAYHRHNTVVASPGAALNSTPDPQPDRSHRTVLAVTVTSRSDGGHYIDQADFAAHVAQWVKTDLRDHHAIAEVTVDDQAAELARAQAEAHQYRTALQGVARKAAVPVAVPPAGQAGLRELIAEALMVWAERNNNPQYARARRSETVTANAYSRADAVLAVLFGPIPADTDIATWTAIRAIQLMNEAGQQRDASSEPHRLALSTALGLGTSAPWDAIRERAAELAGQDVAGDRGAAVAEACRRFPLPARAALITYAATTRTVTADALAPLLDAHEAEARTAMLRELIAEAEECDGHITVQELRRMARKAEPAAETPGPETQAVRHAPGTAILCPDCRAKGHSVCITDGEQQPETQACEETGSALARYIVEQPASVAQAALRVLGFPPLRMEFELADDPATPPAVVAEPGKECAASVSGNCLAEAQSETGCATEDGECIHAGQPGKEA
jgi:hypothetical protein